MLNLRDKFRKIPEGEAIEIEIDRLGAANGKWEIPVQFREEFANYSIEIKPVEDTDATEEERRFNFMMYNKGGEPGITFIS